MKKLMILLLLFYFTACQTKFDDDLTQSLELNELKSSSVSGQELRAQKYDKYVEKFAKALSKSLSDESLRQLIKENAMKQEDGDYDIIWKTFKNRQHGLKNTEVEKTICENMEDSKSDLSQLELETFASEFKKFQISVPVNCEKWNSNEYQPKVAYMLSNYDDTDEFINAFDADGNKITLSINTIPDFPVIVVGLNERCDEEGEIRTEFSTLKSAMIIDPGEPMPPAPPTNLIANSVPSGIYLSWTKPLVLTGVRGYIIERKGQYETDFTAKYTTTGASNTVYTDLNITVQSNLRTLNYPKNT